ncbi:MAG: O-antigen ligase family protein [Saprospiraceae bacterium]|nr:MAG: O-antigen ligase family protein [Saprospiraceae bacterium]
MSDRALGTGAYKGANVRIGSVIRGPIHPNEACPRFTNLLVRQFPNPPNLQILLQSYKAQSIILLFIWVVSMVVSAEFVLSIAMIALLLLALLELKIEGPNVRLTWRESLRENFRKYGSYKAWLAVSLLFLVVLISAAWSGDGSYTVERLRIKLPFLVLPFAFVSMPALRKREIFTIFYFLLAMMFVLSLYVFINFAVNFDAIMASISRGGHLPTPSNHIRFSLTLAFAITGGLALCVEKFHLKQTFERYLIAGMTLFLFVFIHILSVRSGIVALYLGLFVLGGYYVFAKKKYLAGFAGILMLIALPVIAYFTVPSFKLKVNYAQWDYLQFRQGTGGQYPDSERLISMKTGLDIGNANPLLGVGAGDLKQTVKEVYEKEYAGKYNFRMPHNQLISVYAGTGLFGLAVFLTGFFYPLFYKRNYRQPLFLAFHAIVFMSFLVENTLENNFGISLYLFFLLVGLNYLSNQEQQIPQPEIQ